MRSCHTKSAAISPMTTIKHPPIWTHKCSLLGGFRVTLPGLYAATPWTVILMGRKFLVNGHNAFLDKRSQHLGVVWECIVSWIYHWRNIWDNCCVLEFPWENYVSICGILYDHVVNDQNRNTRILLCVQMCIYMLECACVQACVFLQ